MQSVRLSSPFQGKVDPGQRKLRIKIRENVCVFGQLIPRMVLQACQMKFSVSPSTGVLPVRQEKTLVGMVYVKSPGYVQIGMKHVQSHLLIVRKRGCRLPLRSLP